MSKFYKTNRLFRYTFGAFLLLSISFCSFYIYSNVWAKNKETLYNINENYLLNDTSYKERMNRKNQFIQEESDISDDKKSNNESIYAKLRGMNIIKDFDTNNQSEINEMKGTVFGTNSIENSSNTDFENDIYEKDIMEKDEPGILVEIQVLIEPRCFERSKESQLNARNQKMINNEDFRENIEHHKENENLYNDQSEKDVKQELKYVEVGNELKEKHVNTCFEANNTQDNENYMNDLKDQNEKITEKMENIDLKSNDENILDLSDKQDVSKIKMEQKPAKNSLNPQNLNLCESFGRIDACDSMHPCDNLQEDDQKGKNKMLDKSDSKTENLTQSETNMNEYINSIDDDVVSPKRENEDINSNYSDNKNKINIEEFKEEYKINDDQENSCSGQKNMNIDHKNKKLKEYERLDRINVFSIFREFYYFLLNEYCNMKKDQVISDCNIYKKTYIIHVDKYKFFLGIITSSDYKFLFDIRFRNKYVNENNTVEFINEDSEQIQLLNIHLRNLFKSQRFIKCIFKDDANEEFLKQKKYSIGGEFLDNKHQKDQLFHQNDLKKSDKLEIIIISENIKNEKRTNFIIFCDDNTVDEISNLKFNLRKSKKIRNCLNKKLVEIYFPRHYGIINQIPLKQYKILYGYEIKLKRGGIFRNFINECRLGNSLFQKRDLQKNQFKDVKIERMTLGKLEILKEISENLTKKRVNKAGNASRAINFKLQQPFNYFSKDQENTNCKNEESFDTTSANPVTEKLMDHEKEITNIRNTGEEALPEANISEIKNDCSDKSQNNLCNESEINNMYEEKNKIEFNTNNSEEIDEQSVDFGINTQEIDEKGICDGNNTDVSLKNISNISKSDNDEVNEGFLYNLFDKLPFSGRIRDHIMIFLIGRPDLSAIYNASNFSHEKDSTSVSENKKV